MFTASARTKATHPRAIARPQRGGRPVSSRRARCRARASRGRAGPPVGGEVRDDGNGDEELGDREQRRARDPAQVACVPARQPDGLEDTADDRPEQVEHRAERPVDRPGPEAAGHARVHGRVGAVGREEHGARAGRSRRARGRARVSPRRSHAPSPRPARGSHAAGRDSRELPVAQADRVEELDHRLAHRLLELAVAGAVEPGSMWPRESRPSRPP